MSPEGELTHLDEEGRAAMVDVGGKAITERRAVARAVVRMSPATAEAIVDRGVPKGDVLATARIAGIQAAKRTDELIPLCHPLPLSFVGGRSTWSRARARSRSSPRRARAPRPASRWRP